MSCSLCIDGNEPYVLIILNHSLPINRHQILERLWHKAAVRICSDGGANRINALGNNSLVPEFIVGDFDSIRADVEAHFRAGGKTQFLQVVNEETSDAEKCVQFANTRFPAIKHCVLYGFAGGIADKELNCYHLMRKYAPQVLLVDENSVVVLVAPGHCKLQFDLDRYGPRCGLIPLFCAARCTTTGLEWNLRGEALELGKFISVSNRFHEPSGGAISVETDNYVIFTCQLK